MKIEPDSSSRGRHRTTESMTALRAAIGRRPRVLALMTVTALAATGSVLTIADARSSEQSVRLSTLTPVTVQNGWGPIELDRSNGERGSRDGRTLTINGRTYAHGIGVHANSVVEYRLDGAWTEFTARVGIDDEEGSRGSVVFQVYVDGNRAYQSPRLTGRSSARPVSVDLEDASILRLVVTDARDGISHDHADWAEATLTGPAGTSPPQATPSPTPKPTATPTPTPTPTPTITTTPTPTITPTPTPTPTVTPSPTPTPTPTVTQPPTPTPTPTPPPPPPPPPTSPSGGYPTAATTGVPDNWSPKTTVNGDLNITVPGTVIDGYLVTGQIAVQAQNVTIRNTRVYNRIYNQFNGTVHSGLLVEDTEIGPDSGNNNETNGSLGVGGYTARRVHIHNATEGFRVGGYKWSNGAAGPVVIEDSYLNLDSTSECAHSDGVQGYDEPPQGAVVRHNTIDLRGVGCPTGAVFIGDSGAKNAVVENNLLMGGAYTMFLMNNNGSTFAKVRGNRFVDGAWDWGPLRIDGGCGRIADFGDNTVVTIDGNYNITSTRRTLSC